MLGPVGDVVEPLGELTWRLGERYALATEDGDRGWYRGGIAGRQRAVAMLVGPVWQEGRRDRVGRPVHGERGQQKISVKRGDSVGPLAAPGDDLLADPRREPDGTVGKGGGQRRGLGRVLVHVATLFDRPPADGLGETLLAR